VPPGKLTSAKKRYPSANVPRVTLKEDTLVASSVSKNIHASNLLARPRVCKQMRVVAEVLSNSQRGDVTVCATGK